MSSMFCQADAALLPLADSSVDLIVTSPPYLDARTYDINADRKCQEWIEWMMVVVIECVRVCKGPVIVNCTGTTERGNYQPGPEGLMYWAWHVGIHSYRPAIWYKMGGTPGSGGKDWLRNDYEYLLCFKRPGRLPYFDLTPIGKEPKATGSSKRDTFRQKDGSRKNTLFQLPTLANPGNVLRMSKLSGKASSFLAHTNEVCYPEKLPSFFIKAWTKPGDIVLDPFSGSGTTVAAAEKLGRKGIGFDIRFSQAECGKLRAFTLPVKDSDIIGDVDHEPGIDESERTSQAVD